MRRSGPIQDRSKSGGPTTGALGCLIGTTVVMVHPDQSARLCIPAPRKGYTNCLVLGCMTMRDATAELDHLCPEEDHSKMNIHPTGVRQRTCERITLATRLATFAQWRRCSMAHSWRSSVVRTAGLEPTTYGLEVHSQPTPHHVKLHHIPHPDALKPHFSTTQNASVCLRMSGVFHPKFHPERSAHVGNRCLAVPKNMRHRLFAGAYDTLGRARADVQLFCKQLLCATTSAGQRSSSSDSFLILGSVRKRVSNVARLNFRVFCRTSNKPSRLRHRSSIATDSTLYECKVFLSLPKFSILLLCLIGMTQVSESKDVFLITPAL